MENLTGQGIKAKIANAWLIRMQNEGIDKITVQKLATDCEISRQTFYHYFQDIVDVMQWVCEQRFRGTLDVCQKLDDDDPEAALRFFFQDVVSHHHRLMSQALHSDWREQVESIYMKTFRQAVEELLRKRLKKSAVRLDDLQVAIDFYAYGIVGLVLQYCGQPNLNIEDFSRQVNRFIKAGLEALTREG